MQVADAMNSVGPGAFWNLMNFGQMYSYHVLLLPAVVVALLIAHVLLVRRHRIARAVRSRRQSGLCC
jgi:quinol-cytochrome oxidoreductase complex cytochrome b subunit